MHEPGQFDGDNLLLSDFQLRLGLAEGFHEASCEERGADRMLETVVRRARKHKADPAQLPQLAQSLELRCVHDFDAERVQLDVAVDGIIEDFPRSFTDVFWQHAFSLQLLCVNKLCVCVEYRECSGETARDVIDSMLL